MAEHRLRCHAENMPSGSLFFLNKLLMAFFLRAIQSAAHGRPEQANASQKATTNTWHLENQEGCIRSKRRLRCSGTR
jgi:hypothetical protein